MAVKVSFECSRPLTEAELLIVRSRFEDIAELLAGLAVKTDADGIPSFDDVPEYFYIVPLQEEIV